MEFLKLYQNLYQNLLPQKDNNTTLDSSIIYYMNSFFQTKKTVFILTPNLNVANKIYNKLNILFPENTLFFPQDGYLATLSSFATGDFIKTRINTILKLLANNNYFVVGTYDSILQYQVSKNYFLSFIKELKIAEHISRNDIQKYLVNLGYLQNDLVEKPGEYSISGDIINFFPIVESNPIRIVLDYDEIAEIKYFNINSQLSITHLNKCMITPLAELFYNEELLTKYQAILKGLTKLSDYEQDKINKDVINIESRSSLNSLTIYNKLFNNLSTIIDYKDNKEIYFVDLDLYKINQDTINEEKKVIEQYYQGSFFANLEINKEITKIANNINLNIIYNNDFLDYQDIPRFSNESDLANFITKYPEYRVIASDNLNHDLANIFNKYNISFDDNLNDSKIYLGNNIHLFNYIDHKLKYIFINYNVLKNKAINNYKINDVITKTSKIDSINDLEINDYVVHYDYGIGQYLGLKTLDIAGLKKDFLYIVYQNNEAIYVALEDINLVLKYHYQGNTKVVLSKLGSKTWNNLKTKTKQKIKDLYNELLALYKNRSTKIGFNFKAFPELENELAKSFPYEETKDQAKTITEVLADMSSDKVMERLICGDVGFGKTEVAIRAAYRAVLNNKQVIVLVPTTILAKQHYRTFTERLNQFGVNIALYTRFQGSSESKKIKEEFASGKIDILIGTHKIMRSTIHYKDLGLYIIDEEQRFGVKDKETIKYNNTNIDTIYLSATPIPRTLEMSLSGLKAISLIATPPQNRYPVQTYLLKKDYLIIRDIIQKELARGGQVFYLVNEIYRIPKIILKIKQLLGNVSISYLHGQMQKEAIADTLESYINGDINVLVTTTIIENGIDIPNVNTIIIDDATKLGLSQLYQIKGRVGRSSQIAYCYLMYDSVLNDTSRKRLDAIQSFNELGSGYRIAYEDLLIRGAGNFLGAEQSGFINNLGLEMYLELLNEVVTGKEIARRAQNNLKIFNNQTIKKSYINKEALRIEIHKKINKVRTLADLTLLEKELVDRFGKLDSDLTLFLYERLFNYQASLLKVSDVNFMNNTIKLTMPVDDNPYLIVKELFAQTILDNYLVEFNVYKNNLILKIDMKNDKRNWLFFITELFDTYFKKINSQLENQQYYQK